MKVKTLMALLWLTAATGWAQDAEPAPTVEDVEAQIESVEQKVLGLNKIQNENVTAIDKRVAALEKMLMIKGHLFAGFTADLTNSTGTLNDKVGSLYDVTKGPAANLTGGTNTRFRLNMDWTDKVYGIKSRLEIVPSATSYDKWVDIKYLTAYANLLDNMVKLSLGRVRTTGDYALYYAALADNSGLGYYGGTDGLELQFKPAFLPGLNLGAFLPVSVSSTAADFESGSFKKADINAVYKLKDLFNVHAGATSFAATGTTVKKIYGGFQLTMMKDLVAGLVYDMRIRGDGTTSASTGQDLIATLGYSTMGLSIAEDLTVFLPSTGDTQIASSTVVKYVLSDSASHLDIVPRVDFLYSTTSATASMWSALPKLGFVTGAGKHEFWLGYHYKSSTSGSTTTTVSSLVASAQINF